MANNRLFHNTYSQMIVKSAYFVQMQKKSKQSSLAGAKK